MENGIGTEATTTASTVATEAAEPRALTATERAFNIGMFAISTGVTIAFLYYLITEPTRLAEAWHWVRSLPILVQLVFWGLMLPWMIALWIWVLPWALPIRLVLVLGVLGFAEFMLWPWK